MEPEILREKGGDCVTCSVGISTAIWMAKQASNLNKRDGLERIDHANLVAVFNGTPAGRGVGRWPHGDWWRRPIGSRVDGTPLTDAARPGGGSEKGLATLPDRSWTSSALAMKHSDARPIDPSSTASGAIPVPVVLGPAVLEGARRTAASPAASRDSGTKRRGDRLRELDSLRGIAAATVVLCHLVTTALAARDRPGELWALKYTPLHIFWAGHQAVVFFFVLSGFVLALPFYSRSVSYRAFLVKRVFRICVPYWAAVLAALFAYYYFGRHRMTGPSAWLNTWWTEPLSYQLLLGHFLLVDSFQNNVLDGVIWSLVHEMRISLVFPLLMTFLLRHSWRTTLLAAVVLAVVGTAITKASTWLGQENDYGLTCGFVLMFVVGALLCRHRAGIIAWFHSLPAFSRWLCLALAILAYTYPFWALNSVRLLHLSLIDDCVTTVGVAAFIVLALSSASAGRVVTSVPLRWLGSVSYSLYLFHAIVLLTLLKLLIGVVPLWSIWLLAVVMSLAFAAAGHRLLELPSIALGHRLAALLSGARGACGPPDTLLRDS